jgi:transposase-like protein
MEDSIKRWTAKRKTALVVEIIQGKTTVAEASRAYDISPSEIEGWVDAVDLHPEVTQLGT